MAKGVFEKELGSGEWWIRFADSSGRIRREKAGRKTNASKLYALRKAQVLEGRKLPPNLRQRRVLFSELCTDALAYSEAVNSAKSTYELRLKINELAASFGTREAESITKGELTQWLSGKATERQWKPSSRNRWQAALSLIFRVAMDNGKLTSNPAAKIRRIAENNGRVRFLSPDEYRKLRREIEAIGPRFVAAFELALHTGMRASEQFSMHWGQVDFRNRLLSLPKTKSGHPRTIPLNSAAVEALESLKPAGVSSSVSFLNLPVFPNRGGKAIQGPRGWFRAAVDRAGIPAFSWHCLRHHFASKLAMSSVDIRTIGELLGHRSLTMTMRYSHLSPGHVRNAVEVLVEPTDARTDTRRKQANRQTF